MASEMNFQDDEIDIRVLVRAMLRYKLYILAIPLVAMVLVFLYFNFLTPQSYSAQVQLVITKPLYTTNLETQIQGIAQTPEAMILKDLALADDLLWSVYTSSEITSTLDMKGDFEKFKSQLSAKVVGTTVLFLEASNTEPELAAAIVNVWAGQVSNQINSLYGVSEKALSLVEKEAENARLKWDTAQQTLVDKLPDGIVETRKIELTNRQNKLDIFLKSLTELDLLKRDTISLKRSLGVWSDNSPVSIEAQMSLIGLYQRAAGGLEGVQLQMGEPAAESIRTVAEAKASLEALIASIDSQSMEMQAALEGLSQEITSARLALEEADYLYTQLTTERDLAKDAYQALSAQVKEVQIDLARNDLVAKVASHALTPEQAVSKRTLISTLIAGILAFIVMCAGALMISWWKSSAPTEPPK